MRDCCAWVVLFGALLPLGVEQEDVLRLVVWKYPMAGQEEFYRDLEREFAESRPGWRVRVELRSWNEAHASIARWIREGGAPDLAIIPDVWLAEFASALEPYAGQFPPAFLEAFQPVMLERSRYRGENLGFVWAASTKALFYRTDLFRKAGLRPPATWRELLIAARKLNRPPEVCGLAMPGAPELDTADSFYLLLWSNGGELFDRNGRARIDSPQALEALTFYQDLVVRYRVTGPDVVKCNKKCAEELFANGNAAMIETGPWAIREFAFSAAHPSFGVVPLPRNKQQATQLVTDHLVLFKSSQRKALASEFIRFSYQPSWRLRWARLGMVPELKRIAADPFFQSDPAWRVFISELPRSRWIPLMLWEPIDRAIRDTLAEVLAGRQQPAAALRELSVRLASLSGEARNR